MTDERLKIWLSFGKFLFGAGGIGLVSTIINWQIQQQELQVNLRNAEIQYLERFATGALDKDLSKRRSFAQYFATVTISIESRSRWKEYLVLVDSEIEENKRSTLAKKVILVETASKTSAEEENIINLKKRLGDAKEIEEQTALKRELAVSKEKLATLAQELQTERQALRKLKSEYSSLDITSDRGPYAVPKVFIGTWKGKAQQEDIGVSWSIKLSINELSASIEYPSLSCGGVLHPIDIGKSSQLQFRENILYGIDQCVNYGSIVLSLINENELEYSWYYPSGKFGAKGRLNKK